MVQEVGVKVDRVVLSTVGLRLKEPFQISSGVTHERRILLVFIDFAGIEGVAECVAGEAPNYTYETVETARWVLENHLVPAILGSTFDHPRDLTRVMARVAKGHQMAKAALEMAGWDAWARGRNESLSRALGGEAESVPAGVSIGLRAEVGELLDRVAAFLEQGYRRIKLKVEPGRDVELLEAVRRRFPDIPLTVDANAAYDVAAMRHLERLDEFDLQYVEQPFGEDEVRQHAVLQSRLDTAVCLDETITSPARCREALALDACRVINIKPGRVGGHGASVDIHDLCQESGVPVWCGGMLESGIGRAHNIALASLPNMKLPGDTSASDRYWERDVVVPPFTLEPDGRVRVPRGPGIGVELDRDFLAAIEIDRTDLY